MENPSVCQVKKKITAPGFTNAYAAIVRPGSTAVNGIFNGYMINGFCTGPECFG